MIKKTLYFGNACNLRKNNDQLVVKYPDSDQVRSVPIEDIGIVVVDNNRITISSGLLESLMENNTAVITCNRSHLPYGLLLPMYGHHAYTEKLRTQIEASLPLKKNLWQQTVVAKIINQAGVLQVLELPHDNMLYWAKNVRSGDPDNYESRAAVYYWSVIDNEFRRSRFGDPPNNLLNYGYAILRAIVARALVSSGFLPALGIFHRNKYNPYCLADDIMEPFRPFVDLLVVDMVGDYSDIEDITPEMKQRLLTIPALEVVIDDRKSPLMVAAQRTTASLMKCFEGDLRKILYPVTIS